MLAVWKSGETGVANVALEEDEGVELPLGYVHLLQKAFTENSMVFSGANGDGRFGTDGEAVCLETFALESPTVPISGTKELVLTRAGKLGVIIGSEQQRNAVTIGFLRGERVSSRGRPEFALEGCVGLPLRCCPKVG